MTHLQGLHLAQITFLHLKSWHAMLMMVIFTFYRWDTEAKEGDTSYSQKKEG